jgi:hypothetical protein
MASVAAILEIARILSTEAPPGNPVIFMLSDGEEPALLGAEAFITGHPWADNVGVVINLEARGTSGQSILFETTENNSWLIDAYTTHAPRPVVSSLYDEIYKYLPNNTDLTVYEAAGLPGINFAFFEEFAHYHTPLDTLANLNPDSVQHQGDNALAAVRAFAELDLSHPPDGNRVSIDLFPGVIVQWPEPWTLWLAAVCLLLWAGLAILLTRRRDLALRALLWGFLVLPIGVVGAALIGLGVVLIISYFAGTAEPWYAHPFPVRAALWSGALIIQVAAATAVARRAGFWGLSMGIWFWWTIFSLLLAWLLPGMSVIILVPTGLALLVLAGAGLTPTPFSTLARVIAAAAALFGTSSLWLPFALFAEAGAGLELGPITGFSVALATSALGPLLAVPEENRHGRKWLWTGAGLIMAIAAVTAVLVPPYSVYRPQRLNILHVNEHAAGTAYWLIEDNSPPGLWAAKMPASLLLTDNFGPVPEAILPWSDRQYLAASAPPSTLPAPEVHLLANDQTAGERVLEIQLALPRQYNQVALHIPEAAGLRRIVVSDTAFTIEEIPVENGFQTFECYSAACDGLKLALNLESNETFPVFIAATATGLPPGSDVLLQARPDTAITMRDGDVTIVSNVRWIDRARGSE